MFLLYKKKILKPLTRPYLRVNGVLKILLSHDIVLTAAKTAALSQVVISDRAEFYTG